MFEKACPFYLAIGMSYEQFWDGPAELARVYKDAHEVREELQNEAAWLQGIYIRDAVANALNRKKAKYPAEPYPLKTKISRERKKRQQELNELKVVDRMMTWTEQFNKRFAERQEKEQEQSKTTSLSQEESPENQS